MDPYLYRAFRSKSALDIKQVWDLHKFLDPTKWPPDQEFALLIGVKDGGLRLRYPSTRSKIEYLDDASTDLKCLAACAIAGLVPLNILADKLEDEYPHLSEQANHLRKWYQVAQEVANSSYQ